MINEETVKHIATLAKIKINDDELNKYQTQLSDIMSEIDKIVNVKIDEEDIMINPSFNKDKYEEDVIGSHINTDLALKNAKNVKGDYIVVPKVIE